MHVLFIGIWMTVSDYNTNPTVIILVGIGILTKCMFYSSNPTVIIVVGIGILTKSTFYLLVSGSLYQTIIPIPW
jgi:hypothetical protein